jgi:hypothetical protein
VASKNLAEFPRRPSVTDTGSQPAARRSGNGPISASPIPQDPGASAAQFLRALHLLLRSVRLYRPHHPRLIESLKAAGDGLESAMKDSPALGIGVQPDAFLLMNPQQPQAPGHRLADPRGELKALAEVFGRAHVRSFRLVPHVRLDELLQFARAVDEACRARNAGSREDWIARLREHRITGIHVNESAPRPEELSFANLLEAILGSGPDGPVNTNSLADATPDRFRTGLRALWAAASRLEYVHSDARQEAARAIRAEFAEADLLLRSMLVKGVTLESPRETDSLGAYLARVVDALSIDYARSEYSAARLRPTEVRLMLSQLRAEREGHEDDAAADASLDALVERFWRALPARERTRILSGSDAWCLPVPVLRGYLDGLIAAAEGKRAEAPRREARRALADFARCLESEEEKARRAVASGLLEMRDVLERIWPCPQLSDLGQRVVAALHREVSPGIANLLEQVTESLAKLALARGECAEIEAILQEIDRPPAESDDVRLAVLTRKIMGCEEWLLLVDLALANRPLDAAVPRLLRRDPERLLDRLRLLLTSSAGSNALPAMSRLVRAAGEPVLGALETHLLEPRRQRVATSIKLLSAADPGRLIAALPRAFSSWDWSLQDLAVTELARQSAPALRLPIAQAFLALLREANLLVTPGMIDHIGLIGDTSAVPRLIEIASGEADRLSDVFIRIKAIEALGRMRAPDAATLLRNLVRNRSGLTYVEPAGLRSAAEDALALVEDRSGSLSLRTSPKAPQGSSIPFERPRRYLRVALPDPLEAVVEGARPNSARIRSIALGGASIETSAQLALGDSLRLEIRAGFDKIRATAVVRTISAKGCGVEFVHMTQDDREKLRRRINKLLD